MTAAPAGPAVVIGVGNVLLRDDGIGVRAVEAMRAAVDRDPASLPPGTRLVDGGTLGMGLLDEVRGARSLLLLDAVDLNQPAGTVTVLRGGDVWAACPRPGPGSPGGVAELLATARLMGWLPTPVALVGVQVGDTSGGVGLSGPVAAALPSAVAAACGELHALEGLANMAWPQASRTREAEGARA